MHCGLHLSGDCPVARITKISMTLCALLFTTLSFTPAANASEQARHSAVQKSHLAKPQNVRKTTSKTVKKKTTAQTKRPPPVKTKTLRSGTHKTTRTTASPVNEKCTVRKGHKTKCAKVTKLADVHKARMQKAQKRR